MDPNTSAPRKLSRGPLITLTCDCGESRQLRYGQRWQCEKCGRTWDTHRIPPADYAMIRRIRRRFVVIPILVLLAVVATVVLFIVLGRAYSIVLIPLALFVWLLYIRPWHRRRLRRALDNVPKWKIKPE
jgi:Flp pilus assembly protein TadB